jgi:hypothetical protein
MKPFIASLAVLAISQAFAVSSTADAASTPSNDPVHRYVVETANGCGEITTETACVPSPPLPRAMARPAS